MRRIDFYSGLAHYADHMAPVWDALPSDVRGTWWSAPRCADYVRSLGVTVRVGRPRPPAFVVTAGFGDVQATKGCRHVLIEHGSGQTYPPGTDPSYSGGEGREAVRLFLVPNAQCAMRNTQRYPSTPAVVVGSPRVDALRSIRGTSPATGHGRPSTPVVALSFHWDATRVHPAAGWTLPWYEAGLPAIVEALRTENLHVVGHGHPRYARHFARLWQQLGIEHVPDFEDVIRRASVYVCDNSSTQYEAAACGIPNVVLDAPWYPGPEANLWPRFAPVTWDVGEHVAGPDEVVAAVLRALAWPTEEAAVAREAAVDAVYPLLDGKAAERSAIAIAEVAAALQ